MNKIMCQVNYSHLTLNIFIVENAHYKQSNNTFTQSNRIKKKAGSLFSSSPDHE